MSSGRVIVEEIFPKLYLLRIDDFDTRFFEGLWLIPEGITYNAYLYLGEKKVLFDTWKHVYSDVFMETLEKLIDPGELDYIVVHHMEPDHSGALPAVLEKAGNATVLGHPLAAGMIKSFYGVEPRFRAVRDGEVIDLGDERLRIIHTPWMHWPETIMSYLESRRILLSCDAFGSYGVPEGVDDNGLDIDSYLRFTRKYFATVIGSYRGWTAKNINKIDGLGISIDSIAPSHGPVWRRHVERIVREYHKWGSSWRDPGRIVVYYVSMYGFVERVMEKIIERLRARGFTVEVFRFTDKEHGEIGTLLGEAVDAAAVVAGAATYEAGIQPIAEYITRVLVKKVPPKPVLVVSSYGWGGVAARLLDKLFAEKGFTVAARLEYRGGSVGEKDVENAVEKLVEAIRAGSSDEAA